MLQKQVLNLNFSQGLDTKTDPFQVQPGKFLNLENSVFDKAGRLTKRNGFGLLSSLPDASTTYLTTFKGNLTAIGDRLQTYSRGSNTWVDKGQMRPVNVNTLSLIKSGLNQYKADAITASNGLTCVAYMEADGAGSSRGRYAISDTATGDIVVSPIELDDVDPLYGAPRTFILGNYFIVLFSADVTGSKRVRYIAINIYEPTQTSGFVDLVTNYDPSSEGAMDAVVANNTLYVGYNASDVGGAMRFIFLTSTFQVSNEFAFAGEVATIVSMAADITGATPVIYASYYDSGSQDGYTLALDQGLGTVLNPVQIISSLDVANIGSVAYDDAAEIFYEINNTYSYTSEATNYIETLSVTMGGVVSSATEVKRSVGLFSKPFRLNDTTYFLAAFQSSFQPSYFLLDADGNIMAKLAYSNGAGYATRGLGNVTVSDNTASMSYLFKDELQAINRTQGATNPGVYSELGVGLVSFTIGGVDTVTSEIGGNLNITGGFMWSYDGLAATENGFFVWPDPVEATPATSGGSMIDQAYFYQVTYEWSDNEGNLFRSAPSLPISAIVSGGGGSGSVTLDIPTLRLTYKIENPVRIVIYRWSAAQQTYYQVTSITSPLLNDVTVDSVQYVDMASDSAILGGNILYTTGGVLENISPPASDIMTLFNNRLWLVDAENRDLLWYSKQVIQDTPVEMSDLLTMYIAPSVSSEGSTGPITALAPLDDKLIIFKENALGYINGVGPDNTGANSQYSEFVLITSVVGCTNQNSIVFMPNGLMFQSNKGIWLLGRDLSTTYIGAPVEDYTLSSSVLSALNIPATNQVRFTMDSGITLMYDYFFNQWGTFTGIPAVSSVTYQDLQTYVNSRGQVFQETPGRYLDNSAPVLMSFTTSWMNLAGLQGYERFYTLNLLGQYLSPFKLNVQFAYDYNPSIIHQATVFPVTPGPAWGGEALWGSGQTWGGVSNVFDARVFPKIQKCQSFQITINEIFDQTVGEQPGAGLTLSGLAIEWGFKKGTRVNSAARTFGK